MNNKTIVIKKLLGLILAVALLFGTVASVADFAYAQPEEDDSPEVVVLQAGQEEPAVEEPAVEEPVVEEPVVEEPVVEEPVEEEEKEIEEPEPAEEPEPVDEPEEPIDEHEPVEEAEDEENPDEDLEEEEKELGEDSEEPGEDEEQLDEENLEDEENDEDTEEEELAEGEEGAEEESELEEEEYDPGSMLDGFPATEHPSNFEGITMFAPGSLGSAQVVDRNSLMMGRTSLSGLSPGEVRTSKTATPVEGMVNTWDITVRIEGKDNNVVETTDVVLVIDRSGSMAGTRMTATKNAANSFIDTMIPNDPNLRIAIVSFSSSYQGAQLVTINHQFSNNRTTLKNAVNNLVALGGTHTQAGIIQGEALLDGSSADNKFMVLLSDGEPTYSYEPNTFTAIRPDWAPSGSQGNRTYGVYDGNFGSTVRGNGSDLISYFSETVGSWPNQTTYRRYVNNGLAAIKAGVDAGSGIDGLFTIAVGAGSSGTSILADIATPGMAYSTDNPSDLEEIYGRIGTEIATQSALRNAVVVDEMGDGFSLISSTLNTSQGSTSVAPASGANNETITWNLGSSVTNLVPGSSDVRYAEMTYRVEINDEILDVDEAKTNDSKLFETNKVTNLSYLDINDTNKQVSIDSPEVDPVLLKIKKNLTNPMNPEDRIFNVEISKEEQNGFNQTVGLVPNADYVWSTKLRHEGTYNVKEISITGTGFTDPEQFEISYKVDGSEGDSFLVNHIDGVPRGDVSIEVTNTEHGDATPDEPLIRVSKTFSGLTQDQIDQLTDFKITITSQSDSTMTRDLFLSQGTRVVETNGDITYKWEIEGWPAGTYYVVETGHELTNYTVVIENDGTVTTTAATMVWNNELWVKSNTEVSNDLKVDDIPPNLVVAKLTGNRGNFVWTKTRLSASQRLAVVQALSGVSNIGLTMDNAEWYSGEDDIAGNHFYFRGYRIHYDLSTGILTLPQSNQWALIASGAYDTEGGDPADIAVKNSYTLNTVDVTISKEVTGNLGDKQGAFDFTVQVSGEEEPRTFSLAHGQSETLTGIPANAVLTLSEDARGHEVTVKVGDNIIAPSDGKYTITLTGEDITIEVTNKNEVDIDTGITFDNLPYILILGLVSLGLGVMVVRRRYSNR